MNHFLVNKWEVVFMFLHVLTEEAKRKFIELVYKVANSDHAYTEDEQEVVNNYKLELGIDEIPDTDTIEHLLQYFGGQSVDIQKIVYFEIYGMIICDEKLSNEEKEILDVMTNQFSLSNDKITEIIIAVKGLQQAYKAVYDAVF
jgi:uncharacterized tellurite resistance protein B-like protein